jgi:hypothetical protein
MTFSTSFSPPESSKLSDGKKIVQQASIDRSTIRRLKIVFTQVEMNKLPGLQARPPTDVRMPVVIA